MRATLFGVPASHPTLAAELMLRRKGVDFRRVDLVTAAHRRCCGRSASRARRCRR